MAGGDRGGEIGYDGAAMSARREPQSSEATSWQAVRDHLEALKAPVVKAIRAYPPPITGCDAQYNHLLEERERIVRELARLDAAVAESAGGADDGAVDAFIAKSPFFGGA